MSTQRIATLKIQGFRGVPQELLLDLTADSGSKPASLILSGDNGSGKSSIVDALEFCLQGRVGRSAILDTGTRPSLASLLGVVMPRIAVRLSDGSEHVREIYRDPEGKYRASAKPHPLFSFSPIVIRRADILQFWNTPDHKRQMMFWEYISAPVEQEQVWDESETERINYLERKKVRLKKERRYFHTHLLDHLGLDKASHAKVSVSDLLHEHVYKGMSKRKREQLARRGVKIRFDKAAARLAEQYFEISNDIKKVESEIRLIKGAPISQGTRNKAVVKEILASAGGRVTEAFLQISPSAQFVDELRLTPGELTEVSLTVEVVLKNGVTATPQQIFSEANRDLVALLVFLSIALESAPRGQAQMLVLDDVFQSVDSSIRLAVTEYMLKEFSDWQLVFTVHDRLWQEQLRLLMRRFNHLFLEREIVRWEPLYGPIIIDVLRDADILLREALGRGDVLGICARAGLLLEQICNVLSYSLPISVTRRAGDKYTLGDLWPGVLKALKRTSAMQAAVEVERWAHLRNLIGAHYNEWAQTLSRNEAQRFGEAVLDLMRLVQCGQCYRWIERREGIGERKIFWTCRCGNVEVLIP